MSFWLKEFEFKIFSDWILMNEAVAQALDGFPLRQLTAQNPIFKQLETYGHRPSFLLMSSGDEKSLLSQKNSFKNHKKMYTLISCFLANLTFDGERWKVAMAAHAFFISTFKPKSEKAKDRAPFDLIKDITRVFIYFGLTSAAQAIQRGAGDQAINFMKGAVVTCQQFIGVDEPTYKQTTLYCERLLQMVMRASAVKP